MTGVDVGEEKIYYCRQLYISHGQHTVDASIHREAKVWDTRDMGITG